MSSVFAGIDEIIPAQLTYTLPAGAIAVDPISGVEYQPTVERTLSAYVKTMGDAPNSANELANRLEAQKVKAYCIEPSTLPASLGQGVVLQYYWSNDAGRENPKAIAGKLTITKYAPSPISVVTEELGDVFEGYLLIESTSSDEIIIVPPPPPSDYDGLSYDFSQYTLTAFL